MVGSERGVVKREREKERERGTEGRVNEERGGK